jgi:hypothetical protein
MTILVMRMRQEPIVEYKRPSAEMKKVHEAYKLLKAGLVTFRDLDPKTKRLLRYYYGVK